MLTVDSSDEELLSIVAKSAQAKKAAANQNQSRSIHVGKRTAGDVSLNLSNDALKSQVFYLLKVINII